MPTGYTEQPPGAALAPFVECFWTQSRSPAQAAAGFDVLPDGCADILIRTAADGTASAWVIGVMSQPLRVAAEDRAEAYVAVRFRPGQSARFLGTPATALLDRSVPLADVRPQGAAALTACFHGGRPPAHGIAALADYLLAALPRAKALGDPYVDAATRQLVATQGAARIAAVSEACGISRQHLARRFRQHVGLTPKELARILRFRAATELLKTGAAPDGASSAALLGYYDQAHFITEFREFSGMSPGLWAGRGG